MSNPLSQAQVQAFFRDGFLGPLPSFFDPESIDPLRRFFRSVEIERTVHPLYRRFSTRDWHLNHPGVMEFVTHPTLVATLRQLMGDDLFLWRSKLFYKPPGDGPLGWHQEFGTFNGEEIGNDVPALVPSKPVDRYQYGPVDGDPWNITVWLALHDVDIDNGPIRFVRGSHRFRYPIDMVPLPSSSFFQDPFVELSSAEEVVAKSRDCSLVLDIDTSSYFDSVDTESLTFEKAKQIVLDRLSKLQAAYTLDFDFNRENLVTMPMKKGEFVIFFERTMHGSAGNTSPRERLALNCRVASADSLVYPGRLAGQYIDGSNLNISRHHCVMLCGSKRNPHNVYTPVGELSSSWTEKLRGARELWSRPPGTITDEGATLSKAIPPPARVPESEPSEVE